MGRRGSARVLVKAMASNDEPGIGTPVRPILVRLRRVGTGAIVGIIVGLMASHAWSQEPSPPGTKDQPPPPVTVAPPTLPTPGPPLASYPVQLLGLLGPPAQRGPITLTPSIGISEEYNDNVFQNNLNRQSDFITAFSPTVALQVNRPSYQLNAGYSFSAALYAEGTQPNNAFQSQNLVGSGSFQVTRGLTLSVSDFFAFNRQDTNRVAVQGFSTGQQESWSNTFTPGMTWQMTPLNTLTVIGTYSVLRFLGNGTGEGSDTYGIQSSLTHTFTRRFSGIIGYGFTYLDLLEQSDSTSHTPTIGFSYQLTPTLSTSFTGGASLTQIRGETFVSPAASASLLQAFSFGSASLQYNTGVGVAGGFGGSNVTHSVSATLTLSSLLRGLLVAVGPTYHRSDSLSSRQSGQVDVWAVSLGLAATYQVARFVSVFGGYDFFFQRTGGSSSTQSDVDQNRVRFGLQFGYPINFD